MKNINLYLKRTVNFLGSLVGFIILLPLFAVIAAAIKLDSEGPVFFKQERIGKDGKIFKIYKFRTMVVNAEKIGDGLFVFGDTDSRITKIGNILRKTSLDELPQLLNVILGDMSLVGPRTLFHYTYYSVTGEAIGRTGIKGFSQIKTRTTAPWSKRIEIDNEYIDRFSALLDVKILLLTVASIFCSKNIYPETREQILNNEHPEQIGCDNPKLTHLEVE